MDGDGRAEARYVRAAAAGTRAWRRWRMQALAGAWTSGVAGAALLAAALVEDTAATALRQAGWAALFLCFCAASSMWAATCGLMQGALTFQRRHQEAVAIPAPASPRRNDGWD